MKKNLMMSIAAAVLLGTMGVHANDDVIKGEAAAKAKVEEFSAKEEFKAKEDMSKFNKEVKKDLKKVDDVTEVKELEQKDQKAAPTKIKSFEKEATQDEKKTIK